MSIELQNKLEALGFTTYESKVFLVLMNGFNMTAAEIAEEARIPRTSVYDILKLFVDRGYVNEIQTPSKLRYEMIDPDIIEGKIENEFNKKYTDNLKDLKSSFSEFKKSYKSKIQENDPVDVELIKGFNKFRFNKFLNLMKDAKTEMLLMNKMEGHVSADLDEVSVNFVKAGGVIKSIYEASTNFRFEKEGKWVNVTKDDLIKLCEGFEKQGEKIKLAERVPQNMVIFDRQIVYLSLVDNSTPKTNRTDLIIRNKNFAEYMIELFESHWDKSKTVKEYKNEKS